MEVQSIYTLIIVQSPGTFVKSFTARVTYTYNNVLKSEAFHLNFLLKVDVLVVCGYKHSESVLIHGLYLLPGRVISSCCWSTHVI